MQSFETILADLTRLYDEAASTLRADIAALVKKGTLPSADRRSPHAWCYREQRTTR